MVRIENLRRIACVALLLLSLAPFSAQAFYVGAKGGPGVLSQPILGKVEFSLGEAFWGAITVEGSFSFIPKSNVALYNKGQDNETRVNFPLFIGLESRLFFSRTRPYVAKNDGYAGFGLDFPIVPSSILPGFKLTLGYTRRIVKAFYWELGSEYYFYGALQNELFFTTGLRYRF